MRFFLVNAMKLLRPDFLVRTVKHFVKRNAFNVPPTSSVSQWDAKRTVCEVRGSGNTISICPSVHTWKLVIKIVGDNNHLRIDSHSYVSGEIQLFGNGASIDIGERSKILGGLLIAQGGKKITIGAGCLFSTEVDIRTTDSHSIINSSGERLNPDKDVTIGERVWIGRGSTVLKGSTVGNDVVIGAMSVVNKYVQSNTVVAGVPARIVRHGISWTEELR